MMSKYNKLSAVSSHLKTIYKIDDSKIILEGDKAFSVVLAEQLASLPKEVLTEEDETFIMDMTIWKLTR